MTLLRKPFPGNALKQKAAHLLTPPRDSGRTRGQMLRDFVAVLCVALIHGTVSDPLYFYKSGLTGGAYANEDQSAALEEALGSGNAELEQPSIPAEPSRADPTNKLGEAASVLKTLFENVGQEKFVFKVVFEKDSDTFSLVFEPKGKEGEAPAAIDDVSSGAFSPTLRSLGHSKEKRPRHTLLEPRGNFGTISWSAIESKRGQRAPKSNKPPTRSKPQGSTLRPSLPASASAEESTTGYYPNDVTSETENLSSDTEAAPDADESSSSPPDADESSSSVPEHSDHADASGSEPPMTSDGTADKVVQHRIETNSSDVDPLAKDKPNNSSKLSRVTARVNILAVPLSKAAGKNFNYQKWPPIQCLVLIILIQQS